MNLRGDKRVRSLGFGVVACLLLLTALPALGTELKQFNFLHQGGQTQLVFTFDQPRTADIQVAEDGLDLVFDFPNVDLGAMPQQTDIRSPQVSGVQVFHEEHKIHVRRTRLLPYETEWKGADLILTVRDVESISVPASTSTPSTLPAPSNETEEETLANPNPSVSTSTPQHPAVINNVQLLNPSAESISVLLQLEEPVRVEYQWMKLDNPTRLVLDVSPALFRPQTWNASVKTEAVNLVRAAQFQSTPVPITRFVFEVNRPDLQTSVSLDGKELLARVSLPIIVETLEEPNTPTAVLSESLGQESTSTEPSNGESASVNSGEVAEAIQESATEIPAVVEQTEAPVSPSTPNDPAPFTPASTDSPDKLSPAAGTQPQQTPEPIVLEKGEWQPEFFSTHDITFYQASNEETEQKVKQLAIFEERTLTGVKKYEGEPITVDFRDVSVADLMVFFGELSGLNVILDPSVEGPKYRVPVLKLTNVPWDQAFDLVTRMLGLGWVLEGNVLRVAPVDVLAREAEERAKLQENVGEMVTIMKPLSFASATQVRSLAEQLLSPRGEILLDERTNTLIIKETDQNLKNITNLIDTLDKPIPQVNIEARIVQTRRTYSQALGIQWGFRGLVSPALGNQTSLVFPNNISAFGNTLSATTGGIAGNPLGGYAVNLPTQQAPTGAILLSFGSVMDTFRLDAALMALENEGLARILQSPRVSTQNNKQAEIKSGFQIPVQTIVNNTIQVTYVDATLRLQVTPQITADGSVIMNVTLDNKRPDFTQPVLGIPPIITQSAQTTLLVKDGETAVLGGIIQSQDEISHGRVPWFHRIPILGWLFQNKNLNRSNDELLIFLTPRVAK